MKSLVLLALLLVAGSANAKCEEIRQRLEGVVVGPEGKPLAGATVEAAWRQFGRTAALTTTSDTSGRFTIIIKFDPASPAMPGDTGMYHCRGKLDKIYIRGYTPTHQSPSIELSLPAALNDIKLILQE